VVTSAASARGTAPVPGCGRRLGRRQYSLRLPSAAVFMIESATVVAAPAHDRYSDHQDDNDGRAAGRHADDEHQIKGREKR